MPCDVCARSGVKLESLHEQYSTTAIRFVSEDCSDALDARNSVLLSAMLKKKADELKAFLLERRAAKRLARQAALAREASDARRR